MVAGKRATEENKRHKRFLLSWEGLTPKRDSIDVILLSDRARAARITVATPLGVAHHVAKDVGNVVVAEINRRRATGEAVLM